MIARVKGVFTRGRALACSRLHIDGLADFLHVGLRNIHSHGAAGYVGHFLSRGHPWNIRRV